MSSVLRATATEFVPSFANPQASLTAAQPAPLPAHPQEQQQAASEHQDEKWEEGYDYDEYEDGYVDEAGNWVYYDSTEEWQGSDAETQQSWSQEYHQQEQQGLWQQGLLQDNAQAGPNWGGLAVSAEQAVQLLQTWYPRQPLPLLQQLFEACNGSLQDTQQILCEMEWEQQLVLQPPASSSSRPGGSSSSSTQQQEFKLSDELFPELTRTSAQPPAAAQAAPAPKAAAAASFWGEPATALPKGAGSSNSSGSSGSSWATVACKAAAAAATARAGTPSSTAQQARNGQPSSALTVRKGPASSGEPAGATGTANVPWVATGAAVAQEYAAARAEASDYARIRNACFHHATIAFLAGDKALAKELSAKGKQAAAQMWAAHERASQQIFSQRNAQLAASTKQRGSGPVIDLHGLHVREVQAVLPQQLAALAAQMQQHVSVIVGTGHHTKGPPSARVGPAVEALLQGLGYTYRQPQPGLLRVVLR